MKFTCPKKNGKRVCRRVDAPKGMGSVAHFLCKKDKRGKMKDCKRAK